MTQTLAQKPATTRIPRQLLESDVHGKGAAEIGWGSHGDFDRCRAFARRHGIPGHMIDGFCANLHRIATGEWPGRNAHKGAHGLVVDYLVASAGPAAEHMIRWEGPLAVVGEPTGDRRRFPHDTLKYQSFPQPFRFQRQGLQGHQGAVTVGVIEGAKEQMYSGDQKELAGKRVIWGHGYFLDPKIIPEVNEAIHLAEHGVSGPSVDLDSYTAVLKKNALSGETTADMVRGRQRAATLVSVPAFADLRIKVTRPGSALTAAAHPGGWNSAPIAPRDAEFDADDAAKRIEAWANGDPDKMASMFLWIADSANSPLIGRRGYRLPWGDIIDDKPYLIFHAVYAAAALLQGAHGGLPNIPDDEKGKLRSIVSQIYEKLANEFDDASIVAPWDHEDVQQASGEPGEDDYETSFNAALEEFRRTNWGHRYNERKHPRDQRKNKHAGEWIDTPNGPHGQIKVGNKWVYPPKKGEKGYRNPEAAARAKAKRGAGSPAGKTSVGKKRPEPQRPTTAKKPDDAEKRKISRAADKEVRARMTRSAAAKKAPAKKAEPERKSAQEHLDALKQMDRQEQKSYLSKLDKDEIDTLVDKAGGRRLDDDSRDDLETEIIRQVNKGDSGEEKARRADERTKERDRLVREISHEGGKKTVVAKKKEPEPEEKKAPVKKAVAKKAPVKKAAPEKKAEPEKKTPAKKAPAKKVTAPEKKGEGSDADREELVQRRKELKQMEGMIAESEDRGDGGSKRHEDLLEEREQLQRDIDELEAKVGGGKAPQKKLPAKKAVAKKAPAKKAAPEKKTVAKEPEKAPEEKGTSISERLTLRHVRDRGDEGVIKSDRKLPPGAKEDLDGLVEKGLLAKRGRGRYHITRKGQMELKGHESEEPEKNPEVKVKAPEVKTPQKKVTVAKKATGEAKEHKVTPSQQKTLEAIRDGGNGHPASRKVLEREGYLDSDGNLTQKGKDHLGVDSGQKASKGTVRVSVSAKTQDGALNRLSSDWPKENDLPEPKRSGSRYVYDVSPEMATKIHKHLDSMGDGFGDSDLPEAKAEGRAFKRDAAKIRADLETHRKNNETKEPEKTPQVKESERKTAVVKKATGEVKEHKLTAAQKQRLGDIRDLGPSGAKLHPATKKTLVREGYIDEHGSLTDKGRRAIGMPEKGPREKAPEVKAPEVKTPEKKVTVGKKTPLSAAEHKAHLDKVETRAEADEYVKNIRGKDLTDLENELQTGHGGTVAERRERIVERTVGNRLNSKAIREGAQEKTTSEREREDRARRLEEEDRQRMLSRPGAKEEVVERNLRHLADNGAGGRLVGLDELRERIARAGIQDRDEQDALLKKMDREGKLTLHPDAHASTLDKGKRDAALKIGGKDQHYATPGGAGRAPVKEVPAEPSKAEKVAEKLPESKAAPEKVTGGPIDPAKKSTKPRIANNWGGYDKAGDAYAHPDGEIPTAAKSLGRAGDIDVDGDRLDNVLDQIASDTVRGKTTGDEQVQALRDLAKRLPEGSGVRRHIEGVANGIDAPKRPLPDSVKDAPEPLRQLMDFMMKFPIARGGSDAMAPYDAHHPSYVDALDNVLKDWHAGKISAARLPGELESKVYNRRHESGEGKVPVDRKIAETITEIRKLIESREGRDQLTPPSRRGEGKAEAPKPGPIKADPAKHWADQVPEDTGPDGVEIQGAEIRQSVGNYVIKHATVVRKGDTVYLVEHPEGEKPDPRIIKEFQEFHESLPPEVRKFQRSYGWMTGKNPADEFWAKQYNMQAPEDGAGFSLAMAGDGQTTVWGSVARAEKMDGPAKMHWALRHEGGHSVDDQAKRFASRETAWRKAMQERDTSGEFLHEVRLSPRGPGQHPLTLDPNYRERVPWGVTEYGKKDVREDYAESLDLYLSGPIGTHVVQGRRVPLYFRDIWPKRAAVFDGLFPQFAEEQKSKITSDRGGGR